MAEPINKWEKLRLERQWPTPQNIHRVAWAIDGISVVDRGYGDILRYFADLCEGKEEAVVQSDIRKELDEALIYLDERIRALSASAAIRGIGPHELVDQMGRHMLDDLMITKTEALVAIARLDK